MEKKSLSGDGYYLGVDGGGSNCRATLCSLQGKILGRGKGGPANPFQSISQAITSIESATAEAISNSGLVDSDVTKVVAGVGLAGVNLPTFYDAVCEWRHPFREMFLTTDLEIACIGAHDGRDGAVIVAGTGSCGYSIMDGQSLTCGAHGFPFGDKGSGAWIGLEAIKAVLLAADDLGPATSLTELISGQLGAKGVYIAEKMAGGGSRRFAELAPAVFDAAEAGDSVAISIIQSGAEYLSEVARKLWLNKPPGMSLLGGLRDRLLPWMDASIVERLSQPVHQPDVGAVLFVHREFSKAANTSTDIAQLQVC